MIAQRNLIIKEILLIYNGGIKMYDRTIDTIFAAIVFITSMIAITITKEINYIIGFGVFMVCSILAIVSNRIIETIEHKSNHIIESIEKLSFEEQNKNEK